LSEGVLPAIALKRRLSGEAMGAVELREDANVPLICPTCQNVSCAIFLRAIAQ
jgi:hypothetical protein